MKYNRDVLFEYHQASSSFLLSSQTSKKSVNVYHIVVFYLEYQQWWYSKIYGGIQIKQPQFKIWNIYLTSTVELDSLSRKKQMCIIGTLKLSCCLPPTLPTNSSSPKIMKTRYTNLILSLDFTCRNQLQQTLHVC